MKNIHILPTDKPTTLFKDDFGNFIYSINIDQEQNHFEPQHIYITSDEEIKDNDWVYCPVLKKPVFICLDSILMFKNLGYDSNGNSKYKKEWLKKIILTTDPDLIKDGVQAIDDEFLEWFVKNPSCEEVEAKLIEEIPSGFTFGMFGNDEPPTELVYKIIIPKEKPEQEILEETAERLAKDAYKKHSVKDDKLSLDEQIQRSGGFIVGFKEGMIEGAKWQAQRRYSEVEVFNLCREFAIFVQRNGPSYEKQQEWFEQFKKK